MYVDNKAEWAGDAGEEETDEANPNHGNAERCFWNSNRKRGASEPEAEDDGTEFVCESCADTVFVFCAKDEVPDNNQDVAQDDEDG